MARAELQKQKLLILKDLLERQSDEAHPLSMQALLQHLRAAGIRAERKSVYRDLQCLQDYGMDILFSPGPGGGYYLASRFFELPELKLLVDAVQSSRFLTERKSLELIGKLEHLASIHEAGQLRRQVVVSGRVKTMNESIYYNVDRIHEAIAENCRITFRYFDWGPDKTRKFRPDLYEASPYALCWADENYYLIADSPRHGITHYRVDKMASIARTDRPRALPEAGLDLAAYSRAVFSMYHGRQQMVRMRFANSLAGVVIDRFGRESTLVPDGDDHFIFAANVAVSPMFLSWIAGFGGKARILSPEAVVDQYKALLRQALDS